MKPRKINSAFGRFSKNVVNDFQGGGVWGGIKFVNMLIIEIILKTSILLYDTA